MAKAVINLQKESGGIVKISPVDGVGVTEVTVPESGNLVSVGTAVTDNAIARYDGTTGKLQDSSVIIDDNGNVGIGIAPSAWHSSTKAIRLGNVPDCGVLFSSIGVNRSNVGIGANFYYDSSFIPRYTANYPASMYDQSIGIHSWHVASTGTAGSPITWNAAMTLAAGGNLEHYRGGIYTFGSEGITSIDYANSWTNIKRSPLVDTTAVFESRVVGVRTSAILANGTFQSATNAYGSTSDIKLKENVQDASPKLDKLMQVQVRTFNYIGQEDKQIGVIAQEIEQIFPSIVFETKDTKQVDVKKTREITLEDGTVTTETYVEKETVETGEVTKNVKYSVIYMMMLKAMQEQQEIINDLKVRVEKLELGVK